MGTLPCFFFSYARKDHGPYLKKFFKELKKRVSSKGLYDDTKDEVSFRDIDDIEPGQDWENHLADALANALTMVSLYTPWYFARPYCGKEFRVFLERQPTVTFEPTGAARGSQKIVPVLWESWADLERHQFPPAVTKFINLTGGEHHELYLELGLQRLWMQKGRRGPFAEILERIADEVVKQAKQNPLQPLPKRPSLSATPDAFKRQDPALAVADVGPSSILLVYLAASAMAPPSRSARFESSQPGDWRPYSAAGAGGLHLLVRETASTLQFRDFVEPTYNFSKPNAAGDVVNDLREATRRNIPSLIVLDLWLLANQGGREVLAAILADEQWTGGVLIPVDQDDAETLAFVPTVEASWSIPPQQQHRILAMTTRGTTQEFQGALLTIITDLQKRVAANGKVPSPVTGPGPSSPPPLKGPAKRRARG